MFQQSFISLSNHTNKETLSLPPVCIHSICSHGQNTFKSTKEQMKYACLSGHTATSEVTLVIKHFYSGRKQTERSQKLISAFSKSVLFQHTGISYGIRAGIILQWSVNHSESFQRLALSSKVILQDTFAIFQSVRHYTKELPCEREVTRLLPVVINTECYTLRLKIFMCSLTCFLDMQSAFLWVTFSETSENISRQIQLKYSN